MLFKKCHWVIEPQRENMSARPKSDILTLVGGNCSISQWIRDMTLQRMHPVTGKVQVTSLLPHRLWHSVLSFIFLDHASFKWQKKSLYGLWSPLTLFYYSSEAKIRGESRHCIPSERYKKSLKMHDYCWAPYSTCQTQTGLLTTSNDAKNQDYFWNHLCGTVHVLEYPRWSECYGQLHNLC